MDCTSTRIPYRQTGCFSKTILDYIDQAAALKSFFSYSPSLQGIQKAIESRKQKSIDRKILVNALKEQYAATPGDEVQKNIEALLSENTFTITTAHQPNVFTGPLYFIYKILHTIRLSEHLKKSLPQYDFIPVYYMGSEDADLEELGHTYVEGQLIKWETKQTGAVGKMKIDKEFIKLISLIKGQLSVLPYGDEIISLVKECYRENTLIQDATFQLVHALFHEYGLIVLIADSAALKKQMIPVFEDDLFNQTASRLVEKTVGQLQNAGYKAQANPREINLFYLKDNTRERIVKQGTSFKVQDTDIIFSDKELKSELQAHPERFSPNVILRGLYQETILPNLVYIGGGGEIAYWLQLKDLFQHYKVPYPVLLLRNSFLIAEKKWLEKIQKLGFTVEDLFLPEQELMNRLVEKESKQQVKLNGTFTDTEQLYETVKKYAAAIDNTLSQHVEALKAQSLYRLQQLEKKMLRAEKRKFADQQRQIHSIKEKLFPSNGLQERHDNFMSWYAKWGKDFIQQLYKNSLALEQEFVIISER